MARLAWVQLAAGVTFLTAALALAAAAPMPATAPSITASPGVLAASGQPVTVALAGVVSATYWDTIGVFANVTAPPIGFYVSC